MEGELRRIGQQMQTVREELLEEMMESKQNLSELKAELRKREDEINRERKEMYQKIEDLTKRIREVAIQEQKEPRHNGKRIKYTPEELLQLAEKGRKEKRELWQDVIDRLNIRTKKEGRRYNLRRKRKNSNTATMRIGTWNVQGIYEEGAVKNLEIEAKKYKMEILAVQETHINETNMTNLEDYVFFTSGGETRRYGVGFLVSNELKEKVEEFRPISDRMCYIEIGGEHNISILNIHAPTEEKTEETKDEFYEILEETYSKLSRNNIKMIIGDANAKIGRENMYIQITGGESKHLHSNDNGKRLIEFAEEKQMKIMSTHFKRKDVYKGTWTSPDGSYTNQIDHAIVEKRFQKVISNVRSCRGADVNSDHFLVRIDLKAIKRPKKSKRWKVKKQFNFTELQKSEIQTKYEEEITQGYRERKHETSQSIEKDWEIMETVIMKATEKVVPVKKYQAKEKWFDEECRKEIQKRQELRIKALQTQRTEDKEAYKEQRSKAKKLIRRKKRTKLEQKVIETENYYKRKEIRNFYREVKKGKGKNKQTIYIKGKDGKLIGEEAKIRERWKEYFSEMLNEGTENETEETKRRVQDGNQVNDPTKEEIEEIIKSLKNNKSPGSNGITAENIKYGGEELKKQIYLLVKKIWQEEQMPKNWEKATIIPILKNGDPTECNNYRGISLLDVTYKVIATIIKRRVETIVEPQLEEYQAGFRKGRGTTDQIFTMKEVLTTCYEYKIPALVLFIDFKKAYDSVKRMELIRSMQEFEVPPKLERLVNMTLKKTPNNVRIKNQVSEDFMVKTGLRQGDPLSTLLFNIALEKVMRDGNLNRKGDILNKGHQVVGYADDLAIIARNERELKETTSRLVEEAFKMGLQLNQRKCKVMRIGEFPKNKMLEVNSSLGKMKFEEVEEFTYLGAKITSKCDEEKEIDYRIIKANKSAGALNSILREKNLSRKAKFRLYKTVLRPTALYGCETWVLNKKNQERLLRWERRIIRRITGGKKTERGYERRSNKEIYEIYKEPTIDKIIKARRLQWLGHIERMEEGRIPKTIAYRRPTYKKKRGRPRKRWYEAVKADLEEKNIREWKIKSKNRKEWKNITKLWA